jgi:hypothetical protein
MIKKVMQKLGRHRVILDRTGNEPYLERYYLFLKDRENFAFNIFLHKFLKSDPDDFHDHPWRYFTFILSGGYWEWVPVNGVPVAKWRGPGHFRISNSQSLHRIELDPDVAAWTLFVPLKKTRNWGFIRKGKWLNHKKYFEIKSKEAS